MGLEVPVASDGGGRSVVSLPTRPWSLDDAGDQVVSAPRQREALRRRLLCLADMVAAATALLLVLTLGGNRLKLVTLAGTPLVVLLFKVAGLYDREQLRLLRSTLDEAPVLVQMAGLYALVVAIVQSLMIGNGRSLAALKLPPSG